MTARGNLSPARGDFLLSGTFIFSLVALLVNDFALKPYHPSWFSGILSDVAGMVFFPMFAVAIAEFVGALLPRKPLATPLWFWVAAMTTGILLVMVKFTDTGEQIYRESTSLLHGLGLRPLDLATSGVVSDRLDLLAIPAGLVAIWAGTRYRKERGRRPRSERRPP